MRSSIIVIVAFCLLQNATALNPHPNVSLQSLRPLNHLCTIVVLAARRTAHASRRADTVADALSFKHNLFTATILVPYQTYQASSRNV
ncbi:hypothetical protein PtA15_3A673 [Puccinia triticina]|uniref:Secreted protein n=2 Tax=Puccinia triticina TaxID=208348 RepID=A0ABY7CF23_9BASI|nr:uncharacterized protein PtA15_3A673 [Puccinia triticina]WAQ83304.1 hypothetical protein PtA15_3A673 [Puccinia triticina]WAR54154.1 hypothetical protein PtB15_3B666 [Puccinia triticina]